MQAVADFDQVAQTRLPQRVARNRGKVAAGEPLELGLGLGQPIEIRIDQRQTRTPGRTGAALLDEVPDERRDLAEPSLLAPDREDLHAHDAFDVVDAELLARFERAHREAFGFVERPPLSACAVRIARTL